MEKVVIDDDGRVKVAGVRGEVAVTDTSGKPLAFLLPPDVYYRMMLAWLSREPTPDEIEASRRSYREKGGWTTAQVLAHLAEIERDWKERQG